MALENESGQAPDLNTTLARSRSRYKGNRPNRVLAAIPRPTQITRNQTSDLFPNGRLPKTSISQLQEARSSNRDVVEASRAQAAGTVDEGPARLKTDYNTAREQRPSRRRANSQKAELAREIQRDAKASYERGAKDSELGQDPFEDPAVDHGILPADHQGFRGDEHRDWQQTTSHVHRGVGESQLESPKASALRKRRPSKNKEEFKRAISAPMPVDAPQVTTKPAFDAPVSAVNAGERRVFVNFDNLQTSLPVNPTTTPVDIIRAASVELSIRIDSTAHVVLESFKQLGLERPLRRYEHIREVMNSWDNDQQNVLNIAPSPTNGKDEELELKSVSGAQPGDTSVYLYHSQRPGTWDKRWVTLRSDGQIMVAKKDGRDPVNICHLSDFDIYNPFSKQLKKIKPPKKICFAVKSQQKSSMFLTTQNFVHFFSTSQKPLAASWHKAVQEWRSWYLVHVLGQGAVRSLEPSGRLANGTSPGKTLSSRVSSEANQTQPPQSKSSPPRRLPTRHHGPPPVSFPKKLTKDPFTGAPTTQDTANNRPSIVQTQPAETIEAQTFSETGLLGRTYTQRRNAQHDRERNQTIGLPPGPSLSAAAMQQTQSQIQTMPLHSTNLQRHSSQRTKPKTQPQPLSLGPSSNTMKSHHDHHTHQQPRTPTSPSKIPNNLPAGGLVSAATNAAPDIGPDFAPTAITRSRFGTLRRAGGNSANPNSTTHSNGPESSSNGFRTAVADDDGGGAFTGGGLLGAQRALTVSRRGNAAGASGPFTSTAAGH